MKSFGEHKIKIRGAAILVLSVMCGLLPFLFPDWSKLLADQTYYYGYYDYSGHISGVVTRDVDGQPIAGVSVNAYDFASGQLCGAYQTESEGTYTITGLPTGSYRVMVDTGQTGYVNEYYNDTLLYGSATPVAVIDGQTTPGIDFSLALTGGGTPDIRIDPLSLSFTDSESAAVAAAASATADSGSTGTTTVSESDSELAIDIPFDPNGLHLKSIDGYSRVSLAGSRMPDDTPGHPWLPARFINVLVPSGARVDAVQAQADEVLVAKDVLIYPVQPPLPTAGGPLSPDFVAPDPAAYATTDKVPASSAQLTGQHIMRGYSYVSLRLNPVRYIPAKQELYFANRIQVRIHYVVTPQALAAPPANNDLFRSALMRIVVNGEMSRTRPDFAPAAPQSVPASEPTALTDYLIITSEELSGAFQALANHRASRNGFTTAVLTTDTIYGNYAGDDSQARIRACIQDYVNNRGTMYVVLGGDDTVVPDRECAVSANGETENHMPTDLYYAGLDGTWDEDGDGIFGEANTTAGDEGDLAPDVYVGRIPVRTTAQASAYIDKVIDFESNPIAADSLLLLGEELGNAYSGTDRPSDAVNDALSGFQAHTPVSDAEMWVRRLNRDGIQPHWTPAATGHFYDTLTSWDTTTAGDYALSDGNLRTRLNQGWYHVFMMTHGVATSWNLESGAFDTADAAAVSSRLGIIYTGACLTGHFDGTPDPCLSEAFLRDAQGPVAFFGCSRFGWYNPDPAPASNTSRGGPSMEYAYDFYSRLLEHDHSSLGEVFFTHKATNAGLADDNNSDRWIQFGLNYQGDPALLAGAVASQQSFTIYNEGQSDLSVSSINLDQSAAYIQWNPQAPFTVPSGQSVVCTVTVNLDQAPIGQATRRLLVQSNDPDESPYPNGVFVQTVHYLPAISVTPENRDFGAIQTGTSADCTFNVQNTGGGFLAGSASVSSPYSVVSGGAYNLGSGASQTVTVRYGPTESGTHSRDVVFTGGGGATRPVTGSAYSAPAGLDLSNSTVMENQPVGTTVGILSTADPDVGDTFTYTLASGEGSADNPSFTIAGDQLQTAAVFDYETQSSKSIRVRTTDATGLWLEDIFTITVGDVFEEPTKGDLNDDGTVDLADAILALRIVAGLPPGQPISLLADVNGDGEIGMPELLYILGARLSE